MDTKYNYNSHTFLTDGMDCGNGDNCDQICINTDGSLFCECVDGYLLDSDERTCNCMYLEFI